MAAHTCKAKASLWNEKVPSASFEVALGTYSFQAGADAVFQYTCVFILVTIYLVWDFVVNLYVGPK